MMLQLKRVKMKNLTNLVQPLFVAGFLLMALTGFKSFVKPYQKPFKVERQEWNIQHMKGNIPSEEFDIGMTIDVPMGGDSFLVDSVIRLLNEEIYGFFENSTDQRFAPGDLYCPEGKRLIQYYRDAFKPYIVDTCEFHGCCPDFDYLAITLVEQTNSFVTYEISRYFIGEGDCEYLDWITFYKRDGHRLPEVIRNDQVVDLLKCSSGTDYNVTDDVEYRLSIGGEVAGRCSFGLTTDSLRCQYMYAPGIVETFSFDMKTACPYLTEEAEKLLK